MSLIIIVFFQSVASRIDGKSAKMQCLLLKCKFIYVILNTVIRIDSLNTELNIFFLNINF